MRSASSRSMARDPFFGRFSAPRVENSLGSGVIVREDGIIVTNNHVIDGAQSLKGRDGGPARVRRGIGARRCSASILPCSGSTRNGERMPTLAFADTQQRSAGR
jgi:hypothetical protein